jgi:hypothetical protein
VASAAFPLVSARKTKAQRKADILSTVPQLLFSIGSGASEFFAFKRERAKQPIILLLKRRTDKNRPCDQGSWVRGGFIAVMMDTD